LAIERIGVEYRVLDLRGTGNGFRHGWIRSLQELLQIGAAITVEIAEARYGLDVAYKRLSESEAGRGLHSGGKGMEVSYRLRAPAVLSAGYSRNRQPVWGAAGGAPGGTNGLSVIHADGGREDHAFASGIRLKPGDEVLIKTANGGGWGRA
jgi:N-methylhydantoinase B